MATIIFRRQSSGNNGSTGKVAILGATVGVIAILTAILCSYFALRRLRARNSKPKFIPGKFLKRKWEQWEPVGKYKTVNSTERGESQSLAMTNTEYNNGIEQRPTQTSNTVGVDRNTSVRSVMTLPPYSQAPKETEQVIGREGERAGMDTVVEFPETVEEEEVARETEMESLYQIRQARRREIAEREERRRLRREARDRGDWARLEELRRESRLRANTARNGSSGNLTADILIAEHQSRPKDRRVSSVAYADVGQVRHDGTRLRQASFESDRGLLDGAAPMGEHGRNNSETTSLFTMSNLSRPTLPFAGRQRSDSGALSISTTASSFDNNQATPMTTSEGVPRPTSDPQTSNSNSSPTETRYTPDTDEGSQDHIDPRIVSMIRDSDNDIVRPPQYEDIHDWGDAPAYEEQVRRAESRRLQQQQQLSPVSAMSEHAPSNPLSVPRINVEHPSEPSTPVMGRNSEDHRSRR